MRNLSTSLCTACLLIGGCDESGPSSVAEPAQALPLKRGFYVSSDTACDQASNATLGLLHSQGMNGARVECVFEIVEAAGIDRYRIVEHCTEIGSSEQFQVTSVWEILSPTSFRREDSGWQSEMRYCEQSLLPEGWREIDLEAAIVRD